MRRLHAQTSVELAIACFVLIPMLLGLVDIALVGWSRAALAYEASVMGAELPANWQEIAAEDVLAASVTADGLMPMPEGDDSLELTGVQITTKDNHETSYTPSAGAWPRVVTSQTDYITITATARYRLFDIFGLLPEDMRTATVPISRTYPVRTSVEAS